MSEFLNSISGPLDKKACVYFFVLTVLFFFILVFVFVAEVFVILKDFKNLTRSNFIGGIVMLINIFILYFVNRLLYTMCNKSLD